MSFVDDGYEIIRGVLSKDACKILELDFDLLETLRGKYGVPYGFLGGDWGDKQCTKSFFKYGHNPIESLSQLLQPKIEEVVGKTLLPTYTYARMYRFGAELKKHRDRKACEYSATVCLSSDGTDWPIYMDGDALHMQVGDVAVYRGTGVEHWREEYNGTKQFQAFLHYVDANGPNKHLVYDERKYLGFPEPIERNNND